MYYNFLDITYSLILCLSVLFGAFSGAIQMIVRFVFFVCSFFLAYFLYDPLFELIKEYIKSELILETSTIALSYIIAGLICALCASSLNKILENISKGIIDIFLGMILGGARGFLVILLLYMTVFIVINKSYLNANNMYEVLQFQNDKTDNQEEIEIPDWISNSRMNKYIENYYPQIINTIGIESLKQIPLPKINTSEKDSEKPNMPSKSKESVKNQ